MKKKNNGSLISSPVDVLLVTMPFAEVERPSLALGILTAILRKEHVNTRSFYANLILLEYIDPKDYFLVKMLYSGDWLFSDAAFTENKKRCK